MNFLNTAIPVSFKYIYIYIYAFSRRFYPKRLTIAFRLYIFVSTKRSSLRSKRSVITPLRIHSGFYIPAHGETAPCSLRLNVISDYWGERNM